MRHLRSILYALVLAPAVWVLCGVGFTGDLIGRGRDNSVESLVGLLLLLLTGAAYAILVFAPISPAGPLLAGLAFLGAGLWALAQPATYAAQWPAGLSKEGFDLSLPGYGLAVVLAVPMICTALSARRWARYEPPVLPLIGALGRARVTSISVSETTVLPARGPARMRAPELPTQVLAAPAAEPPTEAVPTLVVPSVAALDDDSEATTLLPTGPAAEPNAEPVTQAVARDDGEATTQLSPPDEPTTVLPSTAAPDGDEATTVLPVEAGVEGTDFGPGEKTQVIARNPGETTQVIRPLGAIYPPPGETTQSIRPNHGTAEPPGERTQVIKPPAAAAPPGPPPISPQEETTVEQRPGETSTAERPMTVLKMERPPDETEEDTRPLGGD